MTKQEYLSRLLHQLQYYEGDHSDILANYDSIIDELLNEGLTMDEINEKLGRPGTLVEDIAQEFNLVYTEQTKKNTTLPNWAKTLLIVMLFIILIPTIFSLVFGSIGTLVSILVGVIYFLSSGVFGPGSAWMMENTSTAYRLGGTITAIAGLISCIIITYFIIYWSVRLIKYIIEKIKTSSHGGY